MEDIIRVSELEFILNRHNKTLTQLSTLLEDENLYGITDIKVWVDIYNATAYFLPIDVLGRILGVN